MVTSCGWDSSSILPTETGFFRPTCKWLPYFLCAASCHLASLTVCSSLFGAKLIDHFRFTFCSPCFSFLSFGPPSCGSVSHTSCGCPLLQHFFSFGPLAMLAFLEMSKQTRLPRPLDSLLVNCSHWGHLTVNLPSCLYSVPVGYYWPEQVTQHPSLYF